MDWVDGLRSPGKVNHNFDESSEQLSREHLALAESKMKLVEENLHLQVQKVKLLEDELKKEKLQSRCLRKVLKVVTVVVLFYFLFSWL